MFRLWTERAIPAPMRELLEQYAKHVGTGADFPDDPARTAGEAQGVIASARVQYNGVFFDRTPHLRVVSRTGVGIDNIDVSEATRRGIAVCSTPDGPTISTAEHTITLMLCVAKQVKSIERALRERSVKDFFTHYQGMELAGQTLGLIGLGRIGRRVARIASAIGMEVTAYDPYVSVEEMGQMEVQKTDSIEDVLAAGDVVSIHLPLTSETRHLMNAERFARMKQGSIFVNAARGGLVDETALVAALDAGKLAGAGLDVFDPEPPPQDHPLLHRDNVVATPHIAGVTVTSRKRMWEMAIENAIAVLEGRTPGHIVNPEVLAK
ncbi:MAG: hydroxyacid dehydrogenase [candidate division Zixibacteria bacterium]|nr:hydroxyacid dehydrogenase [candidate division Zixibacteria bacterium]